jgi:hypothetical protein
MLNLNARNIDEPMINQVLSGMRHWVLFGALAMLGRIVDFMGTHRAVRDFAFTGALIICGGVLASHLLAAGIAGAPGRIATLSHSLQGVSKVAPHEEIRSVLDDDILTGSVSRGRIVVLDPCTGEQKTPRQ